ncbi:MULTISPECIES: homoserine dehydrogenase [Rufibacter]|uniref:Homoserine dehydrogenase n=1 Tax=Rufibacter quisquiliarum TaxID=1549639 RepID=A0A839GVI2_9BACT|nr:MULTISPECIES: homoserine dehydrogenase [Rufibacter]MBA9077771.1 homoserine dehydrogenase [Rufibacter quisquiliarum]
MDSNRILKIGLFGFGCVGQGLYDILAREKNLPFQIEKICVKDPAKVRPLPAEEFSFNPEEVLADDQLDLLVEAISDATEAYGIVTAALRKGRRVVTANKKLVAYHLPELLELQEQFGGVLLYEAAVAGGIPIIRTVEEYFSNEPLERVHGILNGSSNYILSQIFQKQKPYADALKEAQDKGFAELDPWLDVAGADSRHKLCILTAHAFGRTLAPQEVAFFGIDSLGNRDLEFARQNGSTIKLVASVHLTPEGEIVPLVLPSLVGDADDLKMVEQEFNGVVVQGGYSGPQLFKGKGAGGHPTGAAVLSDVISISNGYRYGYKKLQQRQAEPALALDFQIEVYLRTSDPNLLESLDFYRQRIIESAADSDSVVGMVTLESLLRNQDKIREAGAFILALSSDFASPKNVKKYEAVELS